MAVTENYLAKVRLAVRESSESGIDEELIDLIEECRLDLQRVGVLENKTNDEMDRLMLGAVRCFVRWKYGPNERDMALNREDYFTLRDEIRRTADYVAEVI